MTLISFKGKTLEICEWAENHPYKKTPTYLRLNGKFYSSLFQIAPNCLLFESRGDFGVYDPTTRKTSEIGKKEYWNLFRIAKNRETAKKQPSLESGKNRESAESPRYNNGLL